MDRFEVFFGSVISICILISGITLLMFLVKRYEDALLAHFPQKFWMTAWLGLIFFSLFLILNGLLGGLINRHLLADHLLLFRSQSWLLIRMGLAFFILNSVLILAFRALIKVLFRIKLH
jgi:hypothetical protein